MFRFLVIVAMLIVASPVYSASTKELEIQIQEIKRVHEAQAGNLAMAMNQLQEVLGQFQKVNGMVDQNSYQGEEQKKILTDTQRRLQILEDKTQSLLNQLEELKAAGLLPTSQVRALEQFKSYQAGLSKFNNQDFRGAVASLNAFVKTYPKSQYLADAQYWIGEGYYAMRDFPKAIAEYQKVVKKFPKSKKASLSLLKQGFSFYEMQSFSDAKAFLSKLISTYPSSTEAIDAKGKINDIDRLLELRQKENLEQKTM